MRRQGRKPWAFAPTQSPEGEHKLRVVTDAAGHSELFIYDYIDGDADAMWGGVSSSMVRDALPVSGDITVRINSPGGDVREGVAILNCLRLHNGRVRAQIDGLAASAASFIAMAGDEVVMLPNSEMMIHDASMFTAGNASDLRADADFLDRVSGNIADVYALRTGTNAEEWRGRMLAETWYSAEEAVAVGLADSVMEIPKSRSAAAAAGNTWDLPYARYAGRRFAPDPTVVAAKVAPFSASLGELWTNNTDKGEAV